MLCAAMFSVLSYRDASSMHPAIAGSVSLVEVIAAVEARKETQSMRQATIAAKGLCPRQHLAESDL